MSKAPVGLSVYGYVEGDAAQRTVVCCVNAHDGKDIVEAVKRKNGQVYIQIDRRWLVPVLQQEAA